MSIPLALPATPLLSHTEKAGGLVVGAMKDIERKFTGKEIIFYLNRKIVITAGSKYQTRSVEATPT